MSTAGARSTSFLSKLVVVLALLASACSGSSSEPEAEPEPTTEPGSVAQALPTAGPTPTPYPADAVLIGMVLADSFVMRDLDHQVGLAAEAAANRLNADGGIDGRPVVVLKADTTSRLSRADQAARRFIEQGVSLLIVTCDAAYAAPAVERAEAADVLTISPCAAGAAWANGSVGPLAFTMVTPATSDGFAMAEVAFDRGFGRAALLVDRSDPDTSDQCRGFTQRFLELGGSITLDAEMTLDRIASIPGDDQVLAAFGADVIVICSFAGLGLEVLNTVRELEVATPILAGPTMDGGWRPPDVEAGLGDYTYLSYAAIEGDDPSPGVAEAIDAFRQIDGAPPVSGRFVVGADAIDVFAAVVEETGSLGGSRLAAAFRGLTAVQASSGTLLFDGAHSPTRRTLRVIGYDGANLVFEQLWDT